MTKKIVAIGFSLDSSEVEEIDIDSSETLSDWEIILFRPTFTEEMLDDYGFFEKVRKHWQTRLEAAVNSGKTVMFFYLNLYQGLIVILHFQIQIITAYLFTYMLNLAVESGSIYLLIIKLKPLPKFWSILVSY